jgi:hypothetical protein
MVIGSGDIGSILNDRDGALMFASGVSNSSSFKVEEFKREHDLLMIQDKHLCIFYFSSISIYTKESPYILHKRKMERTIRSNWNNYNIIRLGNIAWGTNPNTFINYLRAKKEAGEEIHVLDEYRYVIDKEQLLLLTDNLPLVGQNEINVFGRMAKVIDLI